MADPLAILNAEIERKRKAGPEPVPAGNGAAAGPKKYRRRGDIEAERQEQQRREEEQRREKERQMQDERRAADLLKAGELRRERQRSRTPDVAPGSPRPPAAGKPRPGGGNRATPEPAPGAGAAPDPDSLISTAEVLRRLRARGEPVRLFGETDAQRVDRLRALEAQEDKGDGGRNEFMRAVEATDKRLAMETIQRGAGLADEEAERRKAKEEAELRAVDTSPICVDLLIADPERCHQLISAYFRRLFLEWERDLDARPDEEKRSNEGKKKEVIFRQTTDYMKPFFRGLKQRSLDADVVARVSEIAELLQQREYQRANNAYLTLSIGNAPWPIGVTMVGIHERSAREKIFAASVAHVLNDETTRKWIQSLKRLMSWMQDKYPPSDLSKRMG